MKAPLIVLALGATLVACALFIIPEPDPAPDPGRAPVTPMDLNAYSSTAPQDRLRLLFIHHSCGGQLFAPQGPSDQGDNCIYEAAENGGGLRDLLTADGYEIHEASYNSRVGHDTDIFHWLPKFRDQMQMVLKVDQQDALYADDRENQIIMFKSCYPNSVFVGPGQAPGDPAGPELTIENAKATYRALLPIFEAHPDRLFVVVTAPPRVFAPQSLAKALLKRLTGRPSLRGSGPWARTFNNWLVDTRRGWLASYTPKNVVVFDYYDVLTGHGRSDFSVYGSGPDHRDDHPSAAGNQAAAQALHPLINRAVRRAGLSR